MTEGASVHFEAHSMSSHSLTSLGSEVEDSQEACYSNSVKLREFKEYLLKFGDELEPSQPVTIDDSDDERDSSSPNRDVSDTFHDLIKVNKHAEAIVHVSATEKSRWKVFRRRLEKQTSHHLKYPRCANTTHPIHASASTLQRDRFRRAGLNQMSGYTQPQSGQSAETQAYSPSVYKEYAKKAVGSAEPSKEQDRHPTDETSAQPDQTTVHDENEMQIDLVTGFQQSQTGHDDDDSDCIDNSINHSDNEFGSSPGMMDIISSDAYPQQAKTPISRWEKQIENVPGSEATTPALPVNPFGRDGAATGAMMGLSQVFRATQATTPLRPKLMSDPLTERPSPDIYNHQRRPAPAFISSPLANFKTSSDLPTAKSSDPPQRRRENTSRKGRSSSVNQEEDSDIDLGPSLSQKVREHIRRRERNEEIRKSLEELEAFLPGRETRAKTGRGRGNDNKAQHSRSSKTPRERSPRIEKRAAQSEAAEIIVDEEETLDKKVERMLRSSKTPRERSPQIEKRAAQPEAIEIASNEEETLDKKVERMLRSSKTPRERSPQIEKRAVQPEQVEIISDEEESLDTKVARMFRARHQTKPVAKGHGGAVSDVIDSDGIQVPKPTTHPKSTSGTQPSPQGRPLPVIQQGPQTQRDSGSAIPQSHLPASSSGSTRDSVIVRGTPADNAPNSHQPILQGNLIGNKISLAPETSIIRSSVELASTNPESQSTIVQTEPTNRPNINIMFEAVENSSAPQPVVSSGEVVASSVPARQAPKSQMGDVEVTAGHVEKTTSENRLRQEIPSQRDIQLRPDSSDLHRRESSAPAGDLAAVPASSESSHARLQAGSKGRMGEGGAMLPKDKTSLNAHVVIPETSPAGRSWPSSPVLGFSAGSSHSFLANRPRVNSLRNKETLTTGDEYTSNNANRPEGTSADGTIAVPERRSEPNLGKQTTTATGQDKANEDQTVNLQGPSEEQHYSDAVNAHDASEDYNSSSPLSHVQKRRKGNNGNSLSHVLQQPRQSPTSNSLAPIARTTTIDRATTIDRTTTSLGPGQITAQPKLANAETGVKPSERRKRHKHKSGVPRTTGTSKSIQKSPGPRTGQHRSSNNGSSPVVTHGGSPISSRLLRQTRPEPDTSLILGGRPGEETTRPVQGAGEPSTGHSARTVTHPNRVLALFKGVKNAYYPATCLSNVGSNQCQIRFDDGNISILDSSQVRSLILQPGDVVKVDLPNMRQKNFIVVGFRTEEHQPVDPESQVNAQYPRTDIHGHNVAVLKPTSGKRLSIPGVIATDATVNVPLAKLYIVLSSWPKFKDRLHTHQSVQGETETRSHTPARAISAPLTPSSRSRRVKSATPRHGVSAVNHRISELFRNMAFAVTYGENEVDKKLIMKHIKMNGGAILEDGLGELFDMDSAHVAQGRPSTDASGDQTHGLKLKSEWQRTGFVCVLADQHSRRAKYMQALALGIPCLAGCWIEDCVRHNAIISWEPYILPSGESRYLGNAVRNRSLQYYPTETARLSTTIQSRPNLLADKSVLVLRSGETAESRETYFFLLHALGAGRIDRVANIEAANTTLTESRANGGHTWDYLYTGAQRVNSSDLRLHTAYAGMKRKRGRRSTTEDGSSDEPTRIIDSEFVLQSLILGKLMEE
ncbi:MAG: hypothetical protein M1816_003700 [Peltula sp. TS41687]|nr:MAG: hypothetical protein M1816_003700 [Peltula sp. TS41687]